MPGLSMLAYVRSKGQEVFPCLGTDCAGACQGLFPWDVFHRALSWALGGLGGPV